MKQADEQLFGEVLRRFRDRKKLTQQQLAKQIGVNRDSISSWERGEYFPETPTMLHEIARVLDLSGDEKQLLFEALYGTASMLPLHNLPEHNSYFTGREEILAQLHAHLMTGKSVALIQTQAISGLGGIGKTQVAIEYAYRFREYYHDILWVSADSRETLMTSYLTLARLLRLHEREKQEQHKVVEAVKRWLSEHKSWLLILDNIEDLDLVREFVPAPRQGVVVLTTRRRETVPVAEALVLEVLPEEEAILFLLRRAGYVPREATFETASAGDRMAALAIVQAVGGLPLALDQAGAYVAETKCDLSDYLDLFKYRQTALLKRRGTLSHDHPQSVMATFSLAFGQVQQKNEAAIDLLKLCAYLAPDTIPLEVISEGAAYLGTILEPVAVDALHLDQVLETLQAYSLVRRDPKGKTLSIHRLVQAVLRDGMDEATSKLWIERAVQAVNEARPTVEHKNWPQWERLLAQTQQCAQWIEHYDLFIKEAVLLLEETGWYIAERARYKEAEPLLERALKISEHVQGSEHLDTARAAGTLGWLYEKLGKYEQAELLYQRALTIREQQLGAEHPDTAISLDNLADLYENQGKYSEAEPLYRRALQIFEQQLGTEHPDTATSLNNLAYIYENQGKYSEAEPLLQRALQIFEQQLGAEHPDTAASLGNLARIYRSWGKYSEAEPLLQRALQIDEQQLGAEHPYAATSLSNLALLYESQGKYSEAELLYRRALTIREQALGPEHPETAEVMYGLARLREVQGKSEEAKIWYARALAIHQQALGVYHPETTKTRKRFIALLHALGQHEEAAQLDAAPAEQRTI